MLSSVLLNVALIFSSAIFKKVMEVIDQAWFLGLYCPTFNDIPMIVLAKPNKAI